MPLKKKHAGPAAKARKRAGLSLNLAWKLEDGRQLIVRHGKGKKMVCRQKAPGKPLRVGDLVASEPGADGRKTALKVIKRTRKDVTFEILGSCDGTIVDGERQGVGAEARDTKTQTEERPGPLQPDPDQ